MTGAIVALGIVVAVLAVTLWTQAREHNAERNEWREERRALIDRVIATHTGEVIALDRSAAPRTQRPERTMPVAEGL